MIKSITTSELPYISGSDGLVLQGCGGPAEQWLEGINGMLTEEGILENGAVFKDAYVFQHESLTNILYSFDDIEPCNLNMGKFAMWRLQSHSSFGGTWLSDYLPNRLGMELDEQATAEGKPSVRTVPYQIERPIELADCLPGGMETDLKGKVVAVSAEILRPEFQKMPRIGNITHRVKRERRGLSIVENKLLYALFQRYIHQRFKLCNGSAVKLYQAFALR